jgi:hypothetical protein
LKADGFIVEVAWVEESWDSLCLGRELEFDEISDDDELDFCKEFDGCLVDTAALSESCGFDAGSFEDGLLMECVDTGFFVAIAGPSSVDDFVDENAEKGRRSAASSLGADELDEDIIDVLLVCFERWICCLDDSADEAFPLGTL